MANTLFYADIEHVKFNRLSALILPLCYISSLSAQDNYLFVKTSVYIVCVEGQDDILCLKMSAVVSATKEIYHFLVFLRSMFVPS